jgi:hypothetical protein
MVLRWPSRTRRRSSSVTANRSTPAFAWARVPSPRVRHQHYVAEWLAFSTTPLRFPRRGGHVTDSAAYCLVTWASAAVIRPEAGEQTVAIRSNPTELRDPQSADHRVEGVDQSAEVFGVGQDTTPPAGVG